MNVYPRESVEFQPIKVQLDGVTITASVKFCIALEGDRPVTFSTPTMLDGNIGVMVTGLAPDTYHVWAQIVDSPETPVIDCGPFRVS